MSKLFYGGVPTAPDVEKLIKGIPIEPGAQIPYERVEELIGTRKGQSRFLSVTNAWRKRVFREKALQMKAEGGCFIVLRPDEALTENIGSFHRIGRAVGRTRVKIEVIDETKLTPQRAETKRLLQREILAVSEATRKAAKEIAAPKSVSSVVRIA